MKKLLSILILFIASTVFADTDANLIDQFDCNDYADSNTVLNKKAVTTGSAATWKFIPADANKHFTLTAKTLGIGGNSYTCALIMLGVTSTTPKIWITNNEITIRVKTNTNVVNDVNIAWDACSVAAGIADFNMYNIASTAKLTAAQGKTNFTGGADTISPPHGVFHGGSGGQAVRFGWFSDSHNCSRANDGVRIYQQVLTEKIPDMITAFDACDVNFVIGTGDIGEYDTAEANNVLINNAAVTALFTTADINLYIAVGNHDTSYITKAAWLAQMGYTTGYYSFIKNNHLFIILDSMFDAAGADYDGVFSNSRAYYFPQAERTWLTNVLAANNTLPAFVFTHQNINGYYYSGAGAHNTVESADGAAVRAILEAAGNVQAVFQGHTHDSNMVTVNGIKYYTTMAAVDGNTAADADNNAYTIIDINASGGLTLIPKAHADNDSDWTTKTIRLFNIADWTSYHSVAGIDGNALSFDGVNDYVDTGQTFTSDFNDNFSISLWAKPANGLPASDWYLFGVDNGGGRFFESVIHPNGKIAVGYSVATSQTVNAETASVFSNGVHSWTMVTFVVNNITGGNANILTYVNGSLAATSSTAYCPMSTLSLTLPFYLGAINYNGTLTEPFTGSIDDVRIYNKALTAFEVRTLYRTSQGLKAGTSGFNWGWLY